MIQLVTPREGVERYLFVANTAFGPYDSNFQYSTEMVQFNSKLQAMEETKGIFGENSVVHDKVEGDLEYHPILGCSLPDPIYPHEPNAYKYPIYDPVYGSGEASHKWRRTVYGLAYDKGSSLRFSSDMKYCYQIAWMRNPDYPHLWKWFEVFSNLSRPNVVTNFNVYEMTGFIPSKYNTYQVTVNIHQKIHDTGQLGWSTDYDWSKQQQFDAIAGLQSRATFFSASNSTLMGSVYKARCEAVLSPSTEREKIDSLIAQLQLDKFPLEDVHYGDLAMSASDKIQSNDVNMLAFAKDMYGLRNPKEWGPALKKLKQLRNTKDLSNTYLTGIYGVLPTVSDLKTIVNAFKKIGPYIDKNGFSTYGGVHSDKTESDGLHYSLEQRIKLAIADEDDGFMALIQRLDDMGTLPTFENVWDLVPYSFVVDWFIDVGGFLERMDTRLRLARLNIRYVTMSRKTQVKGTYPYKPGSTVVGSINWVHYHRWVSDQCPEPPLSLQTASDFNHWLESSALLQQRANPALTFRRH